jgi:hypothetical protein
VSLTLSSTAFAFLVFVFFGVRVPGVRVGETRAPRESP